MSLLIPEILITNTLNAILRIIRQNHIASIDAGQENRSLLYLLFNRQGIGKYDLYDNAIKLLITTPEDPNHLEVRVGYDHTASRTGPSIFVSLSSESTINNSLQIGEGDYPELVFENSEPNQDQYIKQYSRRYLTTSQVTFVCQNRNEMMVLYYLFRSILISVIEYLSIQGLSNIKIGGQDLRVVDSVPDRLFLRAITLNYEYESIVPEVFIQSIFSKIILIPKIDITDFYNDESF